MEVIVAKIGRPTTAIAVSAMAIDSQKRTIVTVRGDCGRGMGEEWRVVPAIVVAGRFDAISGELPSGDILPILTPAVLAPLLKFHRNC
jgi:hypothetical protein